MSLHFCPTECQALHIKEPLKPQTMHGCVLQDHIC
jgi:hypothetical protein